MPGVLARLWVAAGALAAGAVAGAEWRGRSLPVALALASASALARRRSSLGALGIAGLAFALGWLAAAERGVRAAPLTLIAADVPRCTLWGRVTEGAGGLGTVASVARARCRGYEPLSNPGVVMLDVAADAGATFTGTGWLIGLGTDVFDAARRRLGAHASFEPTHIGFRPPSNGPLLLAAKMRAGLASAARGLGGRRAALLRGLAIGDTSALDGWTEQRFRRAGLSHLLAVSGSNVAIVLGALLLVLARLALWLRVAGAFMALVVFVLVVGPEPSVLRAAVMGGVGLLALAWGRRAEPLHALALALIAVIAARPQMVFSVGLHLSAAATAGLVLWSGPVARVLRPLPHPLRLGLGATLAAQVAVAPILVGTFGELSLAGPPANLLAMPAVPPATVLGLLAAATGALSPALGGAVAAAAGPFVSWILFCGELFGDAPWASLEVDERWGWAAAVPVVCAALAALRGRRPTRVGEGDPG